MKVLFLTACVSALLGAAGAIASGYVWIGRRLGLPA